jgi:hypothetical protein
LQVTSSKSLRVLAWNINAAPKTKVSTNANGNTQGAPMTQNTKLMKIEVPATNPRAIIKN